MKKVLVTNQCSPQCSCILKLNKLVLDVAQSSLNLWNGNDGSCQNFAMQRKSSLLNYLASVHIIEDNLRREDEV